MLTTGPGSIESFLDQLAAADSGPNSFNPFDGSVPDNALRRVNLEKYLQKMAEHKPKVMLLGEAPGYRGMRITGIPFMDRRMLFGQGSNYFGLFGPDEGYAAPADLPSVMYEPTAAVMWRTLADLDFLPLLWSAYPFHPHKAGNPLSNRTPTAANSATGQLHWQALVELFSIQAIIAVGNIAHRSLLLSGRSAPKVRHPAHGGNVKFKEGLEELLAGGIND
ncbi:uracil-DNA glycosylase family protein [Arthrobacter sp.]|uniref:uracil-DNA glycosylase family protein n=1 Tax=Arthrobacter sp. TaxID=1667 RepID=UPI0026E04105|nr:uracil-DNA glycosylase family protein [Arthrobacter sp.]MDO5752916.1 hypothetical protein [Arthrobacter sp.]